MSARKARLSVSVITSERVGRENCAADDGRGGVKGGAAQHSRSLTCLKEFPPVGTGHRVDCSGWTDWWKTSENQKTNQ